MRGVISRSRPTRTKLIAKARSIRKMDGTDLAKVVTTKQRYEWEHGRRVRRADRGGRVQG